MASLFLDFFLAGNWAMPAVRESNKRDTSSSRGRDRPRHTTLVTFNVVAAFNPLHQQSLVAHH